MGEIRPGDIVGRKSYGSDILFRVERIYEIANEKYALLRGLDMRLEADAPLWDLEVKEPIEILEYKNRFLEKYRAKIRMAAADREHQRRFLNFGDKEEKKMLFFEVPGRVIHIDGDKEYLNKCMRNYMQLNVDAVGFYVPEKEQPQRVKDILLQHNAGILVLTGHDGLKKNAENILDLNNYRSSKYFVEAVKAARQLKPSRDDLIIFAGACQSHFEAILEAGANFASSPKRVLIHAYDPVFVVEKIAYTYFDEVLNVEDVAKNSITGEDGIGGIETHGQFRWGYPKAT
ncbi:MAG TPA: sporulation peptidase YabG [Peptococcaceae bacterium]|nr:MAG: Sporulation peptidase YabG [Clostridia bacterium 41_269]HBT20719.1 sporulation peptidase YabG [Peptococcaceae bacterium]